MLLRESTVEWTKDENTHKKSKQCNNYRSLEPAELRLSGFLHLLYCSKFIQMRPRGSPQWQCSAYCDTILRCEFSYRMRKFIGRGWCEIQPLILISTSSCILRRGPGRICRGDLKSHSTMNFQIRRPSTHTNYICYHCKMLYKCRQSC